MRRVPSLEELTVGRRILLTLVLVLIILFALAAFGYFTGGWEAQGEGFLEPPPSPYDDTMRAIEREAVEEAYRDRLVSLFNTWMKDDTGQPARAIQGARKARHAFIDVMQEIEAREKKAGTSPSESHELRIQRRPYRPPQRPE